MLELQVLVDEIMMGISDCCEQVDVLYCWVVQNICYVVVYLGNGGLELNSVQSIFDNYYGDCKDYVMIFEVLLVVKGIVSLLVLIGVGGGLMLLKILVLGCFNYVIIYIFEFDLYFDLIIVWVCFGQLLEGDLGVLVMCICDVMLVCILVNMLECNVILMEVCFIFDVNGNLCGEMILKLGENVEIGMCVQFFQFNVQNCVCVEEQIMVVFGFDG